MKARPGMWRWGATVLGGIIIAMVIFGLLTKRNELGQELTLPDGTVITLVNISFGTEVTYPKPAAWRSLAQHLPSGIVKLWNPIPAGTVFQSFREPALFVLFHRSAAPTNSNTEDLYVSICDESGLECEPRAEGSSLMLGPWGPRGPNDAKLELRSSQAFPRRSKELIVRAYSWSRTNAGNPFINAGEFRISNPAYRSYPQWVPEALPTTRNTGDLSVALTQLEAINDPVEKLRLRKKGLRTGARATFKIMQNGEPATKWKPESIRLSDATGNSLYLWAGDLAKQPAPGQFFSAWRLGLEETGWKLRVELTQQSGFGAEDLCTIQNISVSGQTNAGNSSLQAVFPGGKAIVFHQLIHGINWGGNACVEVGVDGKDESFRIALVKATDQRGQEVEVMKPPEGYGNFTGLHYFGLNLPEDARRLNLTFARKECRFVEFIAKPQEVIVGGR